MQTSKDRVKEEIKFYTEMLKLLSVFILTLSGGIVGLFLRLTSSGFNPSVVVFLSVGIILEVGFVVLFVLTFNFVRELLKICKNYLLSGQVYIFAFFLSVLLIDTILLLLDWEDRWKL